VLVDRLLWGVYRENYVMVYLLFADVCGDRFSAAAVVKKSDVRMTVAPLLRTIPLHH